MVEKIGLLNENQKFMQVLSIRDTDTNFIFIVDDIHRIFVVIENKKHFITHIY